MHYVYTSQAYSFEIQTYDQLQRYNLCDSPYFHIIFNTNICIICNLI